MNLFYYVAITAFIIISFLLLGNQSILTKRSVHTVKVKGIKRDWLYLLCTSSQHSNWSLSNSLQWNRQWSYSYRQWKQGLSLRNRFDDFSRKATACNANNNFSSYLSPGLYGRVKNGTLHQMLLMRNAAYYQSTLNSTVGSGKELTPPFKKIYEWNEVTFST